MTRSSGNSSGSRRCSLRHALLKIGFSSERVQYRPCEFSRRLFRRLTELTPQQVVHHAVLEVQDQGLVEVRVPDHKLANGLGAGVHFTRPES